MASTVLNDLVFLPYGLDRILTLSNFFYIINVEFDQLKNQGAKERAAEVLVSLISSNVSPDFFIPTLILNAKSFLAEDILHPEQVCEVLTSLDDFLAQQSDIQIDDQLTLRGFKHLREHESKLRLLCSTALAKGFLRQA